MTPKERYEVAREQIKHEDGLISNRVTWLQIFQGLLFTAFAAGIGLFKETALVQVPGAKVGISVALCMLALMGIVSAVVAYKAVEGALQQLSKVESWWNEASPPKDFPPIRGESGFLLLGFRVFGSHALLAFAAAWLVLIGTFLRVALW